MSVLSPKDQIRDISTVNDDFASPSFGTDLSVLPDNLEDRINSIITQIKIMGGGSNWYDTPSFTLSSGISLDLAYDFTGSGAGRIITADSGAVRINAGATSTSALELKGTITSIPSSGDDIIISPDGSGEIDLGSASTVVNIIGDIKITGGTPASGNILISDASGIGSWVSPSTISESPMTSAGDLWYRNVANSDTRLPIGANYSVLFSNGSVPSWDDSPTLNGLSINDNLIILNADAAPSGTDQQYRIVRPSTDQAASTLDFVLPSNASSSNQFLQATASGGTQWTTISGNGDPSLADIATNTTSSADHIFAIDNDQIVKFRTAGGADLLTIANVVNPSANVNVGIGVTGAPADFRLEVAGDVGPNTDSAYDLGSLSKRWNELFVITSNAVTANATTVAATTVGATSISATTVVASSTLKLSSLTAGSIPFLNGFSNLAQDNANLFWDISNQRLGVGTNAPSTTLEVVGGAIIDDLTIGTSLDMGSNNIINLATPTAGTDAANKDYVDSLINGLDWQESVIDRQTDGTTDPGASPTTGDRYLLTNTSSLHANFGVISGVGDGDIVQYDGADFIVVYDVSTNTEGGAVYIEDENRSYVYTGASWVVFASIIQHNSLLSLQGGTSNEYYHLTSSEHTELTGWLPSVTLSSNGNTDFTTGGNGSVTASDLTLSGLTEGSIPYVGPSGAISQNNANLFWDNSSGFLGIGTSASPDAPLTVGSETLSGTFTPGNGVIPYPTKLQVVDLISSPAGAATFPSGFTTIQTVASTDSASGSYSMFVSDNSSGTISGFMSGATAIGEHAGAGTIATLAGVNGQTYLTGTGTIEFAAGVDGYCSSFGASNPGTIERGAAFRGRVRRFFGGSDFTDIAYGLLLEDIVGVSESWGLYVKGSSAGFATGADMNFINNPLKILDGATDDPDTTPGVDVPEATAILELESDGKGFLPPRMTSTERDAIVSPATGLHIYNTIDNTLDFWNGSAWVSGSVGSGLTSGALVVGSGSSLTSLALGTANQILGMNSGATANEYKTFSGTANQISISHGAGSVTFSTPQDIGTSSSPTFGGLTLNGNLLPGMDNTYDLGSDALRWSDLFVSGGSIHIGTSGDEAIVGYDTVGNKVDIDKHTRVENDVTGSITDVYGFSANVDNIGSGTIDRMYDYYSVVSNSGSGSVTNGYSFFGESIDATNPFGVAIVDQNAVNYFAGDVGIGKTDPFIDFVSASGDIPTSSGLHIKDSTGTASIAIEGEQGARITWGDPNGTTGERIIEAILDDDIFRFRTLEDDFVTLDTDNILNVSMVNHTVMVGGTTDSFNLNGSFDIYPALFVTNRDSLGGTLGAISFSDTANLDAAFFGVRARGTESSPSAVSDGDEVFTISGVGHDGTNYVQTGSIVFDIDGTVSANSVPGSISVWLNQGGAFASTLYRFDNTPTFKIGNANTDALTDFVSASGDFASTDKGLHIDQGSGSDKAVVAIEGNGGSGIFLGDAGGTSNTRIMEINQDTNVFTIRSINDDLTTNVDQILELDNSSGDVLVGAGNLEVASSILRVDAGADAPIIITPKGDGAFQLNSTGNARGVQAVDMQRDRTATTAVASGDYSTIVGGLENTASGDIAVAMGNFANARNEGQLAHANSGTLGGHQYTRIILRRDTTDASSTELSADGGVPAAGTRLTIPTDTTVGFKANIIARQDSGTNSARFERDGLIQNTGGTTALVGAVANTLDINSTAWSVSIVADDTNDSLQINVTGAGSTNISWVAIVETYEVYNA